ncbi:MFS transporter [Sporolactobacillus shoreicorticis]|uniref:MFS transporter n=1 Tax=Sporolactobacillus shoreicorticis TaxID=1923877 RepID=A0ABW5SAT3_9BACL|nr:MFS transporter [Sporolactobacillus shoreicorticis]MCO7126859.1 MFS transporter [Sporolactobacillus shoreicorticis]
MIMINTEGAIGRQGIQNKKVVIDAETGYYTQDQILHLESRINHLPVSKTMYRIFTLITLGMMLDGFDVYLAGGVLGQLVQSGWSSLALNAAFISTTFIGLFIGSVVTGFVGDWKGRQFAYQINLFIFGIASLASFFVPNMMTLIILRGISGIGLGAEIVTGFTLLGEFVPAASRGKWVGGLSVFANCSAPVATFLGFMIIPTFGWRWMFAIAGVLSIIVWYFRRSLPESPRWYFSQGDYKKAEQIVEQFEAEAKASGRSRNIDDQQTSVNRIITKEGHYRELFSKSMIKRTCLGCMILGAINTAAFTFVTWVPTLLVNSGITVSKSLGYTALMMLGAPVGAFIGRMTVDRLGRKWMIVGALIMTAVLGYIYAFQTQPTALMVIGFLMTVGLYILMAIGLSIYVPELFSTALRMRGNGTAQAVGRLFTIVTPYIVAWLLTSQGILSVFIVIGIFLALTAVLTIIWGPETKQQILN